MQKLMGGAPVIAATPREWLTMVALALGLFILIGLADKFRSAMRWNPEFTRKFVHVATGLLIFFTPYLFRSPIPLIVLSSFFIVVNLLGLRLNLFKGMHDTERVTLGTVYFPLAFLLLVLLFWENHKLIVQLSILILGVADAVAAVVGENVRSPHSYRISGEGKSLEGSLAMAVASAILVGLGLAFLPHARGYALSPGMIAAIAVSCGILAAALESLSWQGSDNLTVPLGTAFLLHYTLTHSPADNLYFFAGMALALAIALASYAARFLAPSGAVATFLLGTIIFGIGQWQWGVPILAFFISSSILSKMWRSRKQQSNLLYEKSSVRDIGQVSANGGVAALAILFFYSTGARAWYPVFLGSLAAVTADTWATEIGALSSKAPRLITTFKRVIPGTSGAVSLIGITGALLGALFIAGIGIATAPAFPFSFWRTVLVVTAAGLLASLVDSLIGATVQAQYRCPVCEKVTEKREHCGGTPTLFIRGHRWINNDVVNAICALSGAGLAALGMALF